MKPFNLAAMLFAVLFFAGCAVAPQNPVALQSNFWDATPKKVGIVMTKVPSLQMTYPGAGCLLCLAAASVANSTLSNYVETLSDDNLPSIKEKLAHQLKAKGIEVVVIDEPIDLSELPKYKSDIPNTARIDFASINKDQGLTHLFVIDVSYLGMQRAYSSYVPTGAPQGVMQGSSFVVNLETHALEWYQPLNIYKGVTDEWDEPPHFPALTNAYYQALETGKDMILTPFAN